jgi:molybdopterin synthase catalytic subunit
MSKNQTTDIVPLFRDRAYEPAPIVPSRDKSIVRREGVVRSEDHIQQLIMDLETEQAKRADHHIAEIRREAVATFIRAAAAIDKMAEDDGTRSRQLQHDIHEFRIDQVQELGDNLKNVAGLAATHIAHEVGRSLYTDRAPERRGILRRLIDE